MKSLNRRDFLKTSAMSAAALGLPAASWAQVNGANDDVRVAVVGFNGRGSDHIKSINDLQKRGLGIRLVALCDVDSAVLHKKQAEVEKDGARVQGYTDIRRLLEDKNVDAISIATPNHWHALATIWSVQAGKDVYVEKPVSHNVSEGRRMVEAARKYGRIVQTGTQIRSSTGIQEAVAWVHEGNLGKIKVARAFCYKRRASIGKVTEAQPVPASVDYDLWCGPAPKVPLMRKRLHYDWHWVWPTGNGDLGNQGIHQMDVARWFLGESALSPKIMSVGGRFGYVDDGETPNTFSVFHDYEKAPLIFEVRGLPEKTGAGNMDRYKGVSVGNVIDCEQGYVVVPSYSEAIAYDPSGKEIKRFKGETSHHGNFLKAVHSRRKEDLNADILQGHLSSALCHTGNISYRLGSKKNPDEIRESFRADGLATEVFGRMLEHLGVNAVDLKDGGATLGECLKMDGVAENFPGNDAANAQLTREYRADFVVPPKV